MSSAFEFKENEVKDLKNQLKVLEQRFESQKEANISIEEILKNKEKEIKNLKLNSSRLEQSLNNDKISTSKKIDTFLKEIGEKSQTIKSLLSQLKELNKLKQNNDKNENEIQDLKNQIVQNKKIIKENELIRLDEQNRCIEELKLKSEEIINLKEELNLLQCTVTEKEKNCLELQNYVDEINSLNKSLAESKDELKLKIVDYSTNNEKLQETIKELQKEKETAVKTMNIKIEKSQVEFNELNNKHKDILSQLNRDKLNKISEERSIECVIKDYNLLTEENAYLKKERQKMLKLLQDMLNKFKIDYNNFKLFAKKKLTDWSLIFVNHIKQLKSEYLIQIKLYHNNLIETKETLAEIKKAYFILKSDCIQNLEYFKVEIVEKYNKDVLNQFSQNYEELERRQMDLLKLHEEIDRKYNC